VILRYAHGDEAGPAEELVARTGATVVSWHHEKIRTIVRHLGRVTPPPPRMWPDDRFDVVWTFTRCGDDRLFDQVPQLVMPDDLPGPIPAEEETWMRRARPSDAFRSAPCSERDRSHPPPHDRRRAPATRSTWGDASTRRAGRDDEDTSDHGAGRDRGSTRGGGGRRRPRRCGLIGSTEPMTTAPAAPSRPVPAGTLVMVIRHGEKPDGSGTSIDAQGIDARGEDSRRRRRAHRRRGRTSGTT
jgi:hypothetical protein